MDEAPAGSESPVILERLQSLLHVAAQCPGRIVSIVTGTCSATVMRSLPDSLCYPNYWLIRSQVVPKDLTFQGLPRLAFHFPPWYT